jgi:Holliday junction resolvase YEN1
VEAELAFLNENGFIDAVVTDDADTLLFGAKQVIRG